VTAGGGRIQPVSQEARQLIVERYRALLRQAGSPLLSSTAVTAQVVDQINSVLDAIPHVDMSAPVGVPLPRNPSESSGPTVATASGPVDLSVEIGLSRAGAGVHPTESLRAATYIYEAAFPFLCREFADAGVPDPEVSAGTLLNRAIMDRMCVASAAYVDFLLQKVHNSHLEERRRIGRDLHDRAAPAVIVGMQSLELRDVYQRGGASERAEQKLVDARGALTEALDVIRALSAESRDTVGVEGLTRALRRYLDSAPPDVRTNITEVGDLRSLPGAYAEELFLVLREATRNALVHASPSTVDIQLSAGQVGLYGCVRDDGTGFDVESTLRQPSSGIGLLSMRERVDLLGGTLTLLSAPAAGTTVEVRVPLPGRLA
jgi:signal transduction histidine kinase